MNDAWSYAVVLLAAGSSRRMGQPKQLLSIGGRTLLQHVASSAIATGADPIVVVLGANAAEIRPCLAGLPIHTIVNEQWEEGLGSSIRAGISALVALAPEIGGVVIALADQPNLTARHILALREAWRNSGRSIIASQFEGRLMAPALFASKHFSELGSLQGDVGARALIHAHSGDVTIVPADEITDLDTMADYAKYMGRKA